MDVTGSCLDWASPIILQDSGFHGLDDGRCAQINRRRYEDKCCEWELLCFESIFHVNG